MGSKTGIEWTDATWNPILGCSRVSEGCRNCYAEGIAGRFGQGRETVYSGLTQIVNGRAVWTGKIVETRQLLQPLSWRKPKRIFVNSMSDLFHENVTEEQRDRIFGVMCVAHHHIYQILTKRPERMKAYFDRALEEGDKQRWINGAYDAVPNLSPCAAGMIEDQDFPAAHIWLGVSVENQAAAEERIPLLLQTPAAVNFISAEPLLGPVDVGEWIGLKCDHPQDCAHTCRYCEGATFLDWAICGGESGPHARPMHPDWARSLRDQCQAAEVPFFFKQWGDWAPLTDQPNESDWSDGEAIVNATQGDIRGYESLADETTWLMRRAGKKHSGAMLDGREWKEFPQPTAAICE